MSSLPVLYSFRRCPYAMRGRMGIAVSGMKTELREIVLRDKPAAMLEASPKGTVPVLVLPDGRVIDESLDIMLHALQHYGDPEGWLTPETGSYDQMMALIRQADGPFKKALDRYKYPNRYVDEEGGCDEEAWRDKGFTFIENLANLLAQTKTEFGIEEPRLFGQKPCLADYAILPFLRQFANVNRNLFDAHCQMRAKDNPNWVLVVPWLDRFLESERFLAIMPKFAVWKPGDDQLIFPS